MALVKTTDVTVAKLTTTAAVLVAMGVVWLWRTVVRARRRVRQLLKEGKPMASHSRLLGHIPAIASILPRLPPGAHMNYVFNIMADQAKSPVIYIDTWPLSDPLLVVRDPKLAAQVTAHPIAGALKPPILEYWGRPISGGPNVFDANGPAWRAAHDVFAPVYSPANLAAEVPLMLDGIHTLRERLRERAADGSRFALEPVVMRFVTDMQARVLLNMDLDTQNRPHPLADAMIRQLKLKASTHLPQNLLFNPLFEFRVWNNGRVLDSHIRAHIRDQFRHHLRRRRREQKVSGHDDDHDVDHDGGPAFKSYMDLALEDYLSARTMSKSHLQPDNRYTKKGRVMDKRTAGGDKKDNSLSTLPPPPSANLDNEFLTQMTRNMRMIFFVGCDSTSSLITYCIHAAFTYPTVLSRMRAEHEELLGHNPAAAAQAIHDEPAVLGRLRYTAAVVKETLRMWPLAGGIRDGHVHLELEDEDSGAVFPTTGFAVVVDHVNLHHNEKYWPRPSEFLPDRFLVPEGHELRPDRDAWRPFEHGLRSCPGQQHVLQLVCGVLACLVREFEVANCYAEIDAEKGRTLDLYHVRGERVYLTEAGSTHPIDGYPCRIRMVGS